MARPPGHSLLCSARWASWHRPRRPGPGSTLIFTKEGAVRKCGGPAAVRDCDYSLASLLCSCPAALPVGEPASYSGHLTVWFADSSALGLLLNFTLARDLKLSLRSASPLPTEYLAVRGLEGLRIHTEATRPDQSLLLHSAPGERPTAAGWQPCADVSFLDVALFHGVSLRSYSVENVGSIAGHFPYFSHFGTFPSLSNKSYVVTFIY
ncbi:LOW QUALITY PROTEIN: exosomal polycystin-1-interacting protein [Molossus nigricans]